MASWLAPILGVVVVGVVIELITKESRLGKLVRAIYSLIVLYVIVSPLPGLFQEIDWNAGDAATVVDAGLVNQIQQTGKQAQIQQTLIQLGYPDAVINVQPDAVYVNLGQAVSDEELAKIKQSIGEKGVYIL